MKKDHPFAGFSTAELLIAISVVAIVAAVIVPKYMSVQANAQNEVMDQISSQLNATYANWKAAGGMISGPVSYGSVILYVLSGKADSGGSTAPATATSGGCTVTDPPAGSGQIRTELPAGALIDLLNPNNAVNSNDYSIIYSSANDSFQVVPKGSGYVSNGGAACGYPNFIVQSSTGYVTVLPSGGSKQVIVADGHTRNAFGIANSMTFWPSDANGNHSGIMMWVNVQNEQLTSMNVAALAGVTGITCCNNLLTSLDVSNINVSGLVCYNNNLGPIYLGGQTPLGVFDYTPQNNGYTASLH